MLLRVAIRTAGYAKKVVLRDIRFELPAGRILALIGPNGSGKTTLIRALSGVLPVVEGELRINGTDLAGANQQERARLLAVVPQSTFVPPSFTVDEVVMMGRTPYINWLGSTTQKDEETVERVMEVTDVTRFKGRRCGELSAGERQRVILARALAQDTPVLLMDEPTSHLDLRYQIEFLELSVSLAYEHNKTVLIALHDLNLAARFGDEVLAMKDGTTEAFGKTEDVLNPQTIEHIYGLPVKVFEAPDGGQKVIIPA
ncbi:MAG: ABC transporter ATP-binding protein [Anaerolineaceae bacterium]|nr:ABC transporter ATP-binding protein [Anaerolineaceae bacterium]